jgi:hypothetical protein
MAVLMGRGELNLAVTPEGVEELNRLAGHDGTKAE